MPVFVNQNAVINLWGLSDFFGVIVHVPSSVRYTNQTGGVTCAHPLLEGVYVPLNPGYPPDKLRDIWAPLWSDYDPAKVQDILTELQLSSLLEAVGPSHQLHAPFRNTLDHWGEAWIPVRIIAEEDHPSLGAFEDHFGVLTYTNSD